MVRRSQSYTIFNAATPKAVTSSTDATPIVVTATSHGFSNGNTILIQGHTTNIAANGIFKITAVTTNTFTLTNVYTAANIAGSGAGAGASGFAVKINLNLVNVVEFKQAIISIDTTGSFNGTLSCVGSIGILERNAAAPVAADDFPIFGATQSASNPWSYIQTVDLDSGALNNGSTGVIVTGTDIHKTIEVNINALKFINLLVTAWTVGSLSAKVVVFDNQ